MPVYSVEGRLGTGKTKFAVMMAREALMAGRRVASNVDLYTDKLIPTKRSSYIRIPDKPTPADLEAIGHGSPDDPYNEDAYGVMILDELGTWLNSRTFQDKSRAGVIDFLIHARKKGWNVFLLVQDSGMIDRQVREALIEYQCRATRMDKVRIPFVGWFLASLHKPWGYFPKFHVVTAKLMVDGQSVMVADRWAFRGHDLHAGYDTLQAFSSDYPHGPHTVLPPWDHVPGQTLRQKIDALLAKIFRPPVIHVPAKPRPRWLQLVSQLPDPDERIRIIKRHLAHAGKSVSPA